MCHNGNVKWAQFLERDMQMVKNLFTSSFFFNKEKEDGDEVDNACSHIHNSYTLLLLKPLSLTLLSHLISHTTALLLVNICKSGTFTYTCTHLHTQRERTINQHIIHWSIKFHIPMAIQHCVRACKETQCYTTVVCLYWHSLWICMCVFVCFNLWVSSTLYFCYSCSAFLSWCFTKVKVIVIGLRGECLTYT